MVHIPGYYILEKLLDEKYYTLYKNYSIERNKMVSLKKLNNKDKDTQIAESIHDYYMSNHLKYDSILQPLKLENHGDKVYVVTELYYGETIRKWLETGLPSIKDFLRIALKICNALERSEERRVGKESRCR